MPFINEYIDYQLEKFGLTIQQLSSGLSYQNIVYKIKNCDIAPSKMLIDNMLHRLGIEQISFEWYIPQADYDLYVHRKNILALIKEEKLTKATKMILEYDKEDKLANLQQQFKLYAKTLVAEKRNEPPQTLVDMYKDVILKTVPDFEQVPLKDLLLSQAEICFILEYAYHMKSVDYDRAIEIYFEVLKFFTNKTVGVETKAIFYPKILFNIYDYLLDKQKEVTIIALCDKGIEYTRQMYKLLELSWLLEIKIRMMRQINRSGDEFEQVQRWHTTIVDIYASQNVSPDYDIKYEIYNFSNYYVIGDVIKKRRALLGMSQVKLAEDICDAKTIYRAEKGKSTPHPKITMELLKKLGLTGDLCSEGIPFVNMEVYELCKKISRSVSTGAHDKAGALTEKLKEKIDMTNPSNIQIVEAYLIFKTDKHKDYDKWVEHLENVLSLTVDIEQFCTIPTEVYLTEVETYVLLLLINMLERTKQVERSIQITDAIYAHLHSKNFVECSVPKYISLCGSSIWTLYACGELSGLKKKMTDLIAFCVKSHNIWALCENNAILAKIYKKEIETTRQMNTDERDYYIYLLQTSYTIAEIAYASHRVDIAKRMLDEI
ncbi:MAG: hypothetical protein ATN35_09765 [Epulopiscium sp. Nele67-Bin004]|nr:MAG: hypothetical protein ATN35_09765 [Epulopiscium sp. Nele67-Bin004]